MPSSEQGLDRRRLKDVKPRGVRSDDGENYAYDNFKHRIERRGMVAVLGEAEVARREREVVYHPKVRCADCPEMIPYNPSFHPDRCLRCAMQAGLRETERLRR